MNTATYYRDHWLDIDEQRLGAYQQMFQWHPAMAPLLTAAQIDSGQIIVDYGCGPGGLALELARRAGSDGHVHGIELNAEFVRLAARNLAAAGFADTSTIHHITDDNIPLADNTADRLVCKNVLEYVTDYSALIGEFHRVVKPGGIAHIIDSDWGMLAVEPLGHAKLNELLDAAECAYRTPRIGRVLYSEMKKSRFSRRRGQDYRLGGYQRSYFAGAHQHGDLRKSRRYGDTTRGRPVSRDQCRGRQ